MVLAPKRPRRRSRGSREKDRGGALSSANPRGPNLAAETGLSNVGPYKDAAAVKGLIHAFAADLVADAIA